jgi:membrane protein
LSTALSVLSDYISNFLPDFTVYVFCVVEVLVSFGIVTLLFAMIFKFLPDVDIEWRSVWIGAMVTSGLFVLGKYLLSIYFGAANPASAYGTAGSVILILLWVSYSCLILFFGAEFTQVYARTYRHKIQPSGHAKKSDRFDKKIGRAIRNIGSGSKDNPDKHSKNAELESAKSKATTNDPDTIVIKRKRPLTD